MRWEIATAVAGAILEINPFDQPNVQQAKDATNALLKQFKTNGRLPIAAADQSLEDVALTLTTAARKALPASSADAILTLLRPGDYFALLAYVGPDPALADALQTLRREVRDRARVATMFGYGPRYLHSTGQLHKGGPNSGVFVLISASPVEDVPIPDQPFSFGTLELAQAIGDFASLEARAAAPCTRTCRRPTGADPRAGRRAARPGRLAGPRTRGRRLAEVRRPESAACKSDSSDSAGWASTWSPASYRAVTPSSPTTAAPTRWRARCGGREGVATLDALIEGLAAPRSVWVMVPSGDPDRIDRQRARPAAVGRRRHHRRRQHQLSTTMSGGRSARRSAGRLCRRRHEWRHLGSAGRLLPDGRREGGCLRQARADLSDARPEGRLSARRRSRRRPLREDDSQRDRIRPDAGVRRRLRVDAREATTSSTSARSPDSGTTAASSDPGCWSWPRAPWPRMRSFRPERLRRDSGEGRWTLHEAIERGVPLPVMTAALFTRFRSREDNPFSERMLAALRNQFGGHAVKTSS
jgi:hypothetical protein